MATPHMHGQEYGGPGSFALMTISIVFAWISKLTMDQIAFLISAVSGLLASASFTLRIMADLKKAKADKAEKLKEPTPKETTKEATNETMATELE
jgi:hypothetical protein